MRSNFKDFNSFFKNFFLSRSARSIPARIPRDEADRMRHNSLTILFKNVLISSVEWNTRYRSASMTLKSSNRDTKSFHDNYRQISNEAIHGFSTPMENPSIPRHARGAAVVIQHARFGRSLVGIQHARFGRSLVGIQYARFGRSLVGIQHARFGRSLVGQWFFAARALAVHIIAFHSCH